MRRVSARPTREISLEERRYESGRDPEVLDIITVPIARPEPEHYQTENQLIDPNYYWQRTGTLSWSQLRNALENLNGTLWLNGDSRSCGQNDRVSEVQAAGITRSLYLIRPARLHLVVEAEGGGIFPARRRVLARFELCGHTYCLVVTDPPIESQYLAGQNGEYPILQAVLCVSLGELFHGHAYKLAAAVITPDRAGSTP